MGKGNFEGVIERVGYFFVVFEHALCFCKFGFSWGEAQEKRLGVWGEKMAGGPLRNMKSNGVDKI